ncbi:MAG: hypothetical protein JWR15_3777, partial [Prosthecobacter sp.]|nr:hypothetical protein [Prosthecobacter sp.]
LLAIAAVNVSSIARAEDNKSNVKSSDEKFIKTAGASGMAEVKIATLGTQKAERADVKELATMLVADHTKANAELSALAESKKVQLSQVIDPKHADAFKDLEKESGKGFDDAFLDHLEKSHKDSISNFEDAEKNGEDAEVKSWASKTLPALRHHLDEVKKLQAK